MTTFIIHERQQLRKDGKVRYYGRAYCLCGGSMQVSTDSLAFYEASIHGFIFHHEGEGHGDTDAKTCRRIRAKREREAIRAQTAS